MTYWTEEKIREVLDGTFTRVTYEGKVATEEVGVDDTPNYNKVGRPLGYKTHKPQVAWTPAEDEFICAMRLRNRPFREIAWLVNRSEESTKKRYRVLRVKGAVMV